MEPALHGAEIHPGDLRDLFVALSLELAQPEHEPVVLRELLHEFLDQATQVSLPIQVVGSHGEVFELERTVIVLPVARQLRERLRSSFFERLLAMVYTHVENFFVVSNRCR